MPHFYHSVFLANTYRSKLAGYSETEGGSLYQTKSYKVELTHLRIADSSSTKAINFSSAFTTKRFPLSRCASAIQIVLPLESIAETQPQLQPALLRLSAATDCQVALNDEFGNTRDASVRADGTKSRLPKRAARALRRKNLLSTAIQIWGVARSC
jgi:hypothetical protein